MERPTLTPQGGKTKACSLCLTASDIALLLSQKVSRRQTSQSAHGVPWLFTALRGVGIAPDSAPEVRPLDCVYLLAAEARADTMGVSASHKSIWDRVRVKGKTSQLADP